MKDHEIAHVVAQEIWGAPDHDALVKYAETITPSEWLAAVTRIVSLAKERPNDLGQRAAKPSAAPDSSAG